MYIKSIELHNFKSFVTEQKIEFKPGINYLVGNNNAGKTTIFRAFDFLTSSVSKDDVISKGHEEEDVTVKVHLANVGELTGKLAKYEPYRTEDDELIIMKSSKPETVKQGKKSVKLTIKTIRVWNPGDEETRPQFENPTGASSFAAALFSPQFIYADLHNEDLQDFGSTKITGKLISSLTQDFIQGEEFQKLKVAHDMAFGSKGVQKYLEGTEKALGEKLAEQFGESTVHFNFNFPSANDLLKKGSIDIEENGILTDASDKGNGMQRALALSIIQIVAERNMNSTGSDSAGMQFFVDEPEIYLHPQAQDKLMDSLINLIPCNQVFITTHSPYILRHFSNTTDTVTILKSGDSDKVRTMNHLYFKNPLMSEVTYKAFGVPTEDLHQHLFTTLQLRWLEREQPRNKKITAFDEYLYSKCGVSRTKEFIPRKNGEWKNCEKRTLPYVIRTEIDHPEVKENPKNTFDDQDLKDSIDSLFKILIEQDEKLIEMKAMS